jgi:hypothetical protein
MEKSKKNKINQAVNFVEELSWLLEDKKNISLKETVLLIKDLLKDDSSEQVNMFDIKSNRLNKNVLVGILPQLFQDNDLFKSPKDILDFAEDVLKIKINRKSKRSRKEYIGWIVCEVPKLNDSQLKRLGKSLENIVGNDSKIKKIKEAKKQPNFSWNDTIIKLSKL